MPSLFDPSDVPDGSERSEVLVRAESVRIERIVSRGASSPPGFWYDQDENEWVGVLAGEGRLAFDDGETVTLGPGDWIDIPAHRRHRVEHTAPETIWLAIRY